MAYGDSNRGFMEPKYSNNKYVNPLTVPSQAPELKPAKPRPAQPPARQAPILPPSLQNAGLSAEQQRIANIIVSTGFQRGLSQRDIAIALATAMQESGLRNLNYGDRDSLGVFQQRPSQGWGSRAQVSDPVYATNKFYDALLRVHNRHTMTVAQAAQKVQRSAYPDAYAKHEQKAWSILKGQTGPLQGPGYDGAGGTVEERIQRFMAAAPRGGITVTSGFRDTIRQEQLWIRAVRKYGSAAAARKWVAPPGSSQHEKGNAWDLRFANAQVRAWAHANAARFGLKFPLANETWHVEIAETRNGKLSTEAVANGATPIQLGRDGKAIQGPGYGASPTLSMEDLAQQYGFAAALFSSDPELTQLVKDATAGGWDAAKFQAKLQATNWYKTRTEAQRAWDARRLTDPASTQAEVDSLYQQLRSVANDMGVNLGDDALRKIAETFARNGEAGNSVLIRNAITAQMSYSDGADFGGEAGTVQDQLAALLKSYGLPADPGYVGRKTVEILQGKATLEDAKNYAVNMAKTLYPALAKNLDSGMTVEEFASPYRSLMTQILEINGEEVDLSKDPLMRKALSGNTGQGEPRPMALYDFELGLRNDQRWLKTNNARDSLMDAAGSVLKDFGLRT